MAKNVVAENGSEMVQLATRISKDLHRNMKLHCVSTGTSMGDFISASLVAALEGSKPATKKAK